MSNAKQEIKVQTFMLATSVEVECPHCNEMQDGFVCDPAGHEFKCDDCGESYKVHADADIEHK